MNGDGMIFWNARAHRVRPVFRYGPAHIRSVYSTNSPDDLRTLWGREAFPFMPSLNDFQRASTTVLSYRAWGAFYALGVRDTVRPPVGGSTSVNRPRSSGEDPNARRFYHRRCQFLANLSAGPTSLVLPAPGGLATTEQAFLLLDGRHCPVEYALWYYRDVAASRLEPWTWPSGQSVSLSSVAGRSFFFPTDRIAPGLEAPQDRYATKVLLGATIADGQPSVAGAVAAWVTPVFKITPEDEAFYIANVNFYADPTLNRGPAIELRNALYYDWRRPSLPLGFGIARIGVMDENGDVTVASQCIVPPGCDAIAMGIVGSNENPSSLATAATFFCSGSLNRDDSEVELQWITRSGPNRGLAGILAATLSMPYQRPNVDACVAGRQEPDDAPPEYHASQSWSTPIGRAVFIYAGRGLVRDDRAFLIATPLDMGEIWPVNCRYGWMNFDPPGLGVVTTYEDPSTPVNRPRQYVRPEHALWHPSLHPDTANNHSVASLQRRSPALEADQKPIVPSLRVEPVIGSNLYFEPVPDQPITMQASTAAIHAHLVSSGASQPHSHLFPTVDAGQPIVVNGKKITGVKIRFRPYWTERATLQQSNQKGPFLNTRVVRYDPITDAERAVPSLGFDDWLTAYSAFFGNTRHIYEDVYWSTGSVAHPLPDRNPLRTARGYQLNWDVDFAVTEPHSGYLSEDQERIHTCLEQFRIPYLWTWSGAAGGETGVTQHNMNTARARLINDEEALMCPAVLSGEYEMRGFSIGGIQGAPGLYCYRGEGKWKGEHKWTVRVLCRKSNSPNGWRQAREFDGTLRWEDFAKTVPLYEPDPDTRGGEWVDVPFDFDCKMRTEHVEMYAALLFTSQEAGVRPAQPTSGAAVRWVPFQDFQTHRGRTPIEMEGAFGLRIGFASSFSGLGPRESPDEQAPVVYPHSSDDNKPRPALCIRGWVRSVMKGSLGVKLKVPSELGEKWDFGTEHEWQSDIANRVHGTQWLGPRRFWDRPDNTPTPISPQDLRSHNSHESAFTHKGFQLNFSADQLEQLLEGKTVVHTKWRTDGAGSSEALSLVMSEGLDAQGHLSSHYASVGVYRNFSYNRGAGSGLRLTADIGGNRSVLRAPSGDPNLGRPTMNRQQYGDWQGFPYKRAFPSGHREYEVAVSLIME